MKKSASAAAFALIVFWCTGTAHAQYFGQPMEARPPDNIEGFTVSGKSRVAAKPNLVEIDLEVSASSELSADAIVKYRDARKRIHDAFTALKLKNVEVEERGLLVDQKVMMQNPYMWGGQMNMRTKTEVQLTRKLVVKATNIREMNEEAVLQLIAKLLDVAQDAGARVGPQNNFNPYYYNPWQNFNQGGLVRFVLDDLDKPLEDAYEKAIADARTRAQRLAKLSGVELGPVTAVREVVIPGERPAIPDDETPQKRLEAAKFQEIAINVVLMVRFDIRRKANDK
jgi:uncharacterized protein YggE